jgi:20S proteasome alpha/beta subunit
MAFSRLTCQYACVREREGGTPVVALRYDVVFASDTRGRSKSMDLRYQTSECEAFRAPPICPEACEEPA